MFFICDYSVSTQSSLYYVFIHTTLGNNLFNMDRPEKPKKGKIIIYSYPCIVSCHLPTMTVLYLLFQLGFLLFLLLLWWLCLGLPKLCWIKVATMDILVFLLILECFHLFTIESVRCEFVIYVLSYVEVSSLHSHFLERCLFFFFFFFKS